MTLQMVLHCIDFFDFSPLEKIIDLRVDGSPVPYILKKGGYYAVTRPLPDSFTLSVNLPGYHGVSVHLSQIPPDKIISLQFLRSERRKRDDALLRICGFSGGAFLILGYGYYRVLSVGDGIIAVKNPAMHCLEGRMFLLRDISEGSGPIISLISSLDTRMLTYSHTPFEYHSKRDNLTLLPAAKLPPLPNGEELPIALDVPGGGVRQAAIMSNTFLKLELSRGQTLICPVP